MPSQLPKRSLRLDDCRGDSIPNIVDADLSADAVAAEKRFMGWSWNPDVLAPATGRYNCHGLTLGSRRTNVGILGPGPNRTVDDILEADGYGKKDSPQPGDIIVYRHPSRGIDHTGFVASVDALGGARVVKVISKWGALEEYLHHERDCHYWDQCQAVEYWRQG